MLSENYIATKRKPMKSILNTRPTSSQKQGTIMTHALQKAIYLLELPYLEMTSFLTSEIEKNPILEITSPFSEKLETPNIKEID